MALRRLLEPTECIAVGTASTVMLQAATSASLTAMVTLTESPAALCAFTYVGSDYTTLYTSLLAVSLRIDV